MEVKTVAVLSVGFFLQKNNQSCCGRMKVQGILPGNFYWYVNTGITSANGSFKTGGFMHISAMSKELPC